MDRLPKFIRQQIDCPCCSYLPENENCNEFFASLRKKAVNQATIETKMRLSANPVPTEIESQMGVFVEMLEPQVRQVVIELNCKGYPTENSGFASGNPELQQISGHFLLDRQTKRKLRNLGVDVKQDHKSFNLSFIPEGNTLEEISAEWQKIVSLMPISTDQYVPTNTIFAVNFRKTYTPQQ